MSEHDEQTEHPLWKPAQQLRPNTHGFILRPADVSADEFTLMVGMYGDGQAIWWTHEIELVREGGYLIGAQLVARPDAFEWAEDGFKIPA